MRRPSRFLAPAKRARREPPICNSCGCRFRVLGRGGHRRGRDRREHRRRRANRAREWGLRSWERRRVLQVAEDVAASVIRGHLEGVAAVVGVAEVRVGAVVEKHFDHDEAVVAADGVLERRVAPLGHVVRVGAAVEGEEEALLVVPVGFASGEPGEGALVAAAGADEDFDDGVVVGFRGVVAGLLIVGIGAVFEEEAGEAGVTGEAGGSVDGPIRGRGVAGRRCTRSSRCWGWLRRRGVRGR